MWASRGILPTADTGFWPERFVFPLFLVSGAARLALCAMVFLLLTTCYALGPAGSVLRCFYSSIRTEMPKHDRTPRPVPFHSKFLALHFRACKKVTGTASAHESTRGQDKCPPILIRDSSRLDSQTSPRTQKHTLESAAVGDHSLEAFLV